MSIALSTARASVRRLTRDTDLTTPATRGPVLDQTISNCYQLVAARLHVPMAWTTITAITAGDADYTLTSGDAKEFHSIGLFRLASTLDLVEKVGPSQLEAMRAGRSDDRGEPIALSILEAAPSAVGTTETTFTLYPAPHQADTLQGLAATVPGVVSADADKIQLGQYAQRAIEYCAAAELVDAMTDATLERLQINGRVADTFRHRYEQFIEWEQVRISRQRSGRFANRSYTRP